MKLEIRIVARTHPPHRSKAHLAFVCHPRPRLIIYRGAHGFLQYRDIRVPKSWNDDDEEDDEEENSPSPAEQHRRLSFRGLSRRLNLPRTTTPGSESPQKAQQVNHSLGQPPRPIHGFDEFVAESNFIKVTTTQQFISIACAKYAVGFHDGCQVTGTGSSRQQERITSPRP